VQDKYIQKMHFKQHGVALPEFMKIDSEEDAEEAGKVFGYPLMLKSRRDAYDGRGNAVAQSSEALPLAISSLGGIERGLYAVAPRPHNSGHYTIEACYVSQYEQHLRCVLGLPLGDPNMKVPASLMYNILGEADGEEGFAIAHATMRRAMTVPGASVHWYEKPEIRKQRKMGHITVVGPSSETVRARMDWIINTKGIQEYPQESALTATESTLAPSASPVGIIMGSDSDLPVMALAAEVLDSFGVAYELTVVSAHRTPERMVAYAQNAHKRGVKVIIAGAGGAAHLPGMVASLTPLPVVGVPVKGSHTDGLDSLLSIVQMPRGIPVATVAIQNATNAGLLAVRILGVEDPRLFEKMGEYQESLKDMVLEKAERLETVGWQEYLKK
jgi:phosphoribosylaminoimidazole carboxylase